MLLFLVEVALLLIGKFGFKNEVESKIQALYYHTGLVPFHAQFCLVFHHGQWRSDWPPFTDEDTTAGELINGHLDLLTSLL